MPIRVYAIRDAEAGVWVAKSADVPGLVTEAPCLGSLKAKLDVLIPELLAANGMTGAGQSSLPVELLAEYREHRGEEHQKPSTIPVVGSAEKPAN